MKMKKGVLVFLIIALLCIGVVSAGFLDSITGKAISLKGIFASKPATKASATDSDKGTVKAATVLKKIEPSQVKPISSKVGMPKPSVASEYCKIISPVSTDYQWIWDSEYSGDALCNNEGLACTGVSHYRQESYRDNDGKLQATNDWSYWLSPYYCGEIIGKMVEYPNLVNDPEVYSEPYAGYYSIQERYDAVLCCKKPSTSAPTPVSSTPPAKASAAASIGIL